MRLLNFSSTAILFLFFAGFIAPEKTANKILASETVSPNVNDTLSADTSYQNELEELVSYLKQRGYDIEHLLEHEDFEIYGEIKKQFTESAERKSPNKDEYKKVLNFDNKRDKMQDFIQKHHEQLKEAEEEYDIPMYVIAAIIGVESDYGNNIGSYNPFNAYVSMYVTGYRDEFALAQLEELLKFTERKGIDIFELKSSYAGAMTYAQFIPYSLNKWFVGDDIFDMNDNIMSVANYLAYFKKRKGNIKEAVLSYNTSELYTEAVLDLAEAAEQDFNGDG